MFHIASYPLCLIYELNGDLFRVSVQKIRTGCRFDEYVLKMAEFIFQSELKIETLSGRGARISQVSHVTPQNKYQVSIPKFVFGSLG